MHDDIGFMLPFNFHVPPFTTRLIRSTLFFLFIYLLSLLVSINHCFPSTFFPSTVPVKIKFSYSLPVSSHKCGRVKSLPINSVFSYCFRVDPKDFAIWHVLHHSTLCRLCRPCFLTHDGMNFHSFSEEASDITIFFLSLFYSDLHGHLWHFWWLKKAFSLSMQ